MNLDRVSRIRCSVAARLLLLICIFCGVFSMSKGALANESSVDDDSFAFTSVGDHQYGANGIGVWLSTGRIRIGISNALSGILKNNFDGVGLLDAQLSSDDLKRAKNIHEQLCHAAEDKPPADLQVDPMINYSISCIKNKKVVDYQGRLGEIPKRLAFLANDFLNESINRYISDGRLVVKFDVAVSGIRREKDKFLVAVRFFNGGHFPIRMRTPDQWNKLGGDRLDVSGFRVGGNGEWRTDLAGLPVVNKDDYLVETIEQPMGELGTFVTLPEGGSVTFKFLAIPTGKVPEGTYEFGALIFTSINVKGVYGVGGRVNFVSDRAKPARVTFDTKYPSTPEEWKDYETHQREKMSSHPVHPGAVIPESGYYRKVSASGERSQFVTDLRKGDRTPALDSPFVHWEWDADLVLPARRRAGEPCPREGRWVARAMMMGSSDADLTFSEYERWFRMGDLMPSLSAIEVPYLYWAWLGA
ncbi:hypothetical protein GR157_36295 [Burkholderia sp. 4701]|nr:hypothetical protein [Burkholderia sp. 4701]MXN87394.1 hypothetical protein [Burkholderia sp. 4812]